MKEIADRIRKVRLERGMTQQELADAIGLKSRSSINKIEMNTYEPGLEQIKRIARALNCDPDYLVFGQENDVDEEIKRLMSRLSAEKKEEALQHTIMRYNKARGVQKTSIHMFRHTFARMYLVECGGDALKLQKLLGHTTLQMTQHYVRLFDTDLVKDFQDHSPLEALQPTRIVLRKKAKK